jgi:hypothetical protein
MYKCLDCGRTFSTPKYWQETHGLDYGPYEQFSGCPFCGGDYEDAGDLVHDGLEAAFNKSMEELQ